MTAKTISKHDRENGAEFLPHFNESGLISAVVTDVDNGQPLMLAHMNEKHCTFHWKRVKPISGADPEVKFGTKELHPEMFW